MSDGLHCGWKDELLQHASLNQASSEPLWRSGCLTSESADRKPSVNMRYVWVIVTIVRYSHSCLSRTSGCKLLDKGYLVNSYTRCAKVEDSTTLLGRRPSRYLCLVLFSFILDTYLVLKRSVPNVVVWDTVRSSFVVSLVYSLTGLACTVSRALLEANPPQHDLRNKIAQH